jgi:DNA-binding LacI/PurR family transcriptional regulator
VGGICLAHANHNVAYTLKYRKLSIWIDLSVARQMENICRIPFDFLGQSRDNYRRVSTMSIARIAKHAGVSISTVSRVVTQSRPVQAEIEKKVRSAIEELRLPIRQIRRRERPAGDSEQKTTTIAIITLLQEYHAWFTDPVIGSVIAQLGREAAELELPVLLAEMLDPHSICSIVRRGQVDGALVLIPGYADSNAVMTLAQKIPVVRIMGAQIEPSIIDQVAPDDLGVGFMAAKYLMDRGCNELAFMTFAPDWVSVLLRAQGFFRAASVRSRTIPVEFRAYFIPPPYSVDGSYGNHAVSRPTWDQIMLEFVARRPTGLFVPRDADLPQAYRLLTASGIQPGKDITIVSCDNVNSILSALPHRPASIDLQIGEIARRAIDRLLWRIKNPQEPVSRTLMRPELVLPPGPGTESLLV